MKRLALLPVLLFAACSSNKVNIIRPEIELVQLVGPADVGYPTGQIDIQYGMRVSNRSQDEITLRRIDISSLGSGAYTLRREQHPFHEVVSPDRFADVTFWVRALARGGPLNMGVNEPVTVRIIVYFDSPAGPFTQILQRDLLQFEGARGQ